MIERAARWGERIVTKADRMWRSPFLYGWRYARTAAGRGTRAPDGIQNGWKSNPDRWWM